jgi:hypothetical protein
VPDSTTVRFAVSRSEPRIVGRSVDWQRGTPRLVTPRGDTVLVPDSGRVEVRLKNETNQAVAGGVLGLVVGFVFVYVECPPPKTYCGEQNPGPYFFGGLGALIGAAIRTDHWVRVRYDTK